VPPEPRSASLSINSRAQQVVAKQRQQQQDLQAKEAYQKKFNNAYIPSLNRE